MVGRDGALGDLRRQLEQTGDGKRFVLVGGEPGIGKTRLASEFATEAHVAGATVLFGRASEGLAAPYLPFVEALQHFFEHASPAQLEEVEEQTRELQRIVPAARGGPGSGRGGSSSGAEQFVLFAAAASLLGRIAARAPLVLVLDDVHWADEGSLRLLEYLFTGHGEFNALVVATFRTTEVVADGPLERTLTQLGRERPVPRIELEGLSDAETLAMITDLVGHGLKDVEVELAAKLQREARGNPLFLAELVRSLIASRTLVEEDGRWKLADRLDEIQISPTLTGIIGRRVQGLGESARSILAFAATIGLEFDPGLVARAADADAVELAEVWDAAERAGLVRSGAAGEPFSFAHPLVGRAIQEGLGPGRRGAVNRRVAEAIEASPDSGDAARLASHWAGAVPSDPARARAAAAAAGRQALDRFDGDGAASWYRRALGMFAADQQEGAARCRCLIGLGVAQRQVGDAAFRETLLEAARLAERLGDRDLLVDACLANFRGFSSASGTVDAERVAMLEAALRGVGEDPTPAGPTCLPASPSSSPSPANGSDACGSATRPWRSPARAATPRLWPRS